MEREPPKAAILKPVLIVTGRGKSGLRKIPFLVRLFMSVPVRDVMGRVKSLPIPANTAVEQAA